MVVNYVVDEETIKQFETNDVAGLISAVKNADDIHYHTYGGLKLDSITFNLYEKEGSNELNEQLLMYFSRV